MIWVPMMRSTSRSWIWRTSSAALLGPVTVSLVRIRRRASGNRSATSSASRSTPGPQAAKPSVDWQCGQLFGTGTEGYFGYALSSTERFAHPYHAQTLAPGPGDGFGGSFSMNRFLILDPVPFSTSLRFDLEIWHWSETTVDVSALLYWYAQPGGGDDLPR